MLLTLTPSIKSAIASKSLRLVLASGSPRRKEILTGLFGNEEGMFEVITSNFEENLKKEDFPNAAEYSLATATGKVKSVVSSLVSSSSTTHVVVIGADTVVCSREGRIIEKPSDEKHAHEILKSLSGKKHTVHTGVIVMSASPSAPEPVVLFKFTTTTAVSMIELSDAALWAYVNTGEPMDKAGAYGIQGIGRCLIDAIEGDFFNVMGFPACGFALRFYEVMKDHPSLSSSSSADGDEGNKRKSSRRS